MRTFLKLKMLLVVMAAIMLSACSEVETLEIPKVQKAEMPFSVASLSHSTENAESVIAMDGASLAGAKVYVTQICKDNVPEELVEICKKTAQHEFTLENDDFQLEVPVFWYGKQYFLMTIEPGNQNSEKYKPVGKKFDVDIEVSEEERALFDQKIKDIRNQKFKDEMHSVQTLAGVGLSIQEDGYKTSTTVDTGSAYFTQKVDDPEKDKYLWIYPIVENLGNERHHANPINFTLRLKDGTTITNDVAMYSADDPFEAVTLSSGGKAKGWLIFVVPKSETEFTLEYEAGWNEVISKSIYVE